jgi:hypothetical protein
MGLAGGGGVRRRGPRCLRPGDDSGCGGAPAGGGPPGGYLDPVQGVAAFYKNAWAVGTTNYATTMILHWNGQSWGT